MPLSLTENSWPICAGLYDPRKVAGIDVAIRNSPKIEKGYELILHCLAHGNVYASMPYDLGPIPPTKDQVLKLAEIAMAEHGWFWFMRFMLAVMAARDGVHQVEVTVPPSTTIEVDEHDIGWPRAAARWTGAGAIQIEFGAGVASSLWFPLTPDSMCSVDDDYGAHAFVSAQAFVAHVRILLHQAIAMSRNDPVAARIRSEVLRHQGGMHMDPWRMRLHDVVESLCALKFAGVTVMPVDAELTWIQFLKKMERR